MLKYTFKNEEFKIFLIKFFIVVFYISILFKSFSLVAHASDDMQDVFKLYGDSYNSYSVMDIGGNTIENLFPYYCLCFFTSFANGNYITVICPESTLVDNGNVKGVDRRRVFIDSSGKITGCENAAFFQMTGYNSSNTVQFENEYYVVRTMKIETETPYKGLFLSYNSEYVHDATWGIATSILSRFKAGHLTAEIGDSNVTVDTTAIEQLIADNNTIASDTKSVVTDIKDEIKSSSSSTVGLQEEDRILFKRYDIWLVSLLFVLSFSVFRNIVHQTGRNIRQR